jgi:hypothetical protein
MTLTTEETVWQTIAQRLRTAGSLSYIKKVIEGDRQVNIDADVPCIVLEPKPSNESWVELPMRRQVTMKMDIRGVIDIRNRLDKQIIGDDSQVGIYRLENDIKKAFEGSDIRLANNINNYELETLEYRNVDNAIREVVIRLSLELKYFEAEARI